MQSIPPSTIMEEMGTLAADCIIISCCCQCLALQVIVFVFINLPIKIGRKMKNYAKKKLQKHRRRRKGRRSILAVHCGTDDDGKPCSGITTEEEQLLSGMEKGSLSWIPVDGETVSLNYTERGKECIEEVESVLQELSLKGEFAFGSFWGRGSSDHQEKGGYYSFRYDKTYVHCDLIQVLSSSSTYIQSISA